MPVLQTGNFLDIYVGNCEMYIAQNFTVHMVIQYNSFTIYDYNHSIKVLDINCL